MRIKSIVTAGLLAFAAALAASPAFAQEKKAAEPLAVCANCHEKQQSTILLTGHGAQLRRQRLARARRATATRRST